MRSAMTQRFSNFHFGVQPHGNAPEGSDPQDEFRGKNILIERHTMAETAQHFKKAKTTFDNRLPEAAKNFCQSASNVRARTWTTKSSRRGTV